MKITDYAPRAAAMDAYITDPGLTGIEIGVDAGAHAEALLTQCAVKKLYLVDPWEGEFSYGFCKGRLCRFRTNVQFIRSTGHSASRKMGSRMFDFIYIDIPQTAEHYSEALKDWWPMLQPSGIMGCRNYSEAYPGMKAVIDEFVSSFKLEAKIEKYHNEIVLFKPQAIIYA